MECRVPEIRHPVDKVCYLCRYYLIVVGEGENGPYCKLHKIFFPDPTAWINNPFKKKAGDRTCSKWEANIK